MNIIWKYILLKKYLNNWKIKFNIWIIKQVNIVIIWANFLF